MAKTNSVKRWKRQHGYTYGEIAALCAANDWPVTECFVKHFANELGSFGYDFAEFFSRKITKGDVPLADLLAMRKRVAERKAAAAA